ncbi:MAG: hypothetical protein QOF16_1184, partial [Actinomycetota bacterium]|nr:hypothetical protein [Actinomycetota bacterium]
DQLTGDNNVNYLFGWVGNDVIAGAGGNDQIDAGTGYFDTDFNFHTSGDTDSVDGGDGTDICKNASTTATPPETATSCEDTTTAVTRQPLTGPAEDSQTFRRSF